MKKPNIQQRGRIVFEGELAVKFWVRALDLEKDMEKARLIMEGDPHGKWGSIPIVAEYEVDPGLKFVYLILADFDHLGINGGTGVVYFTDPTHLEEVTQLRDEFAEEVMKSLKEGKVHQEMVVMDDKDETHRLD
jgi:hypothetical protein